MRLTGSFQTIVVHGASWEVRSPRRVFYSVCSLIVTSENNERPDPGARPFGMGWTTGLEPATSGSTSQRSAN